MSTPGPSRGLSDLIDAGPFSPAAIHDRYAYYEALGHQGPIHWLPEHDLWLMVGFEEVSAALRDPGLFSSELGYAALRKGKLAHQGAGQAQDLMDVDFDSLRLLISLDPPDHTHFRRLVSRAFTPRTVAQIEPRLRESCRQMVAEMVAKAGRGAADLITDLAVPFPVTVIAELLGIPSERRADFRRWSDVLAGAITGIEDLDGAQQAGVEMFTFMTEMTEERRHQPADDLISQLVAGSPDEPDMLTSEEVTLFAILLMSGGTETTTNLLGNLAYALDTHPEQAAEIWDDPTLLPAAIEEALRWDSPIQGFLRGTREATTVAGVEIPAGADVLLCFGAANSDPNRFVDPRRFDIHRTDKDHVAFGRGVHFCLGASLARLETRIVFETLIEAGLTPRALPGQARTTGFVFRGFTSYPVAFDGPQP